MQRFLIYGALLSMVVGVTGTSAYVATQQTERQQEAQATPSPDPTIVPTDAPKQPESEAPQPANQQPQSAPETSQEKPVFENGAVPEGQTGCWYVTTTYEFVSEDGQKTTKEGRVLQCKVSR